MIIINQDRNEIVNWDNVTSISLAAESITDMNRTCIIANLIMGGDCIECDVVLGTYDTEKRAKDILHLLACTIPSPYYMPKE